MRRLLAAALAAFLCVAPALAAESIKIPDQSWGFEGPFGTFDRAALQRGFQVYKEICAACHALNQIRFRDLGPPGVGGSGGLGFNAEEVKALAAETEVADIDENTGEPKQRPGLPKDRFKQPFANPIAAAAANNGAAPPDLSLMVKARAGGADYVYALLTGYADPPSGVAVMEGLNYNKFFPGHQIAMAKPIAPDQVAYADGTKASEEQIARDVATFLAWTAEPEMEARKRLGLKVVLFLLIVTALLYVTKRKIWSDVH